MRQKNRELKLIFTVLVLVFAAFLAVPVLRLLVKSFWGEQGVTGEFYTAVLVAFVLAYAVHYTRLPGWVKTALRGAATLPMFIPTITYGFAIIYSFGKQGLITQLLGFQLFNIYGFWGLLVGYVIYTVPVAFLLICSTMEYVDKKTLVVSKVMGAGRYPPSGSPCSARCWAPWRGLLSRPSSCALPTSASPPPWGASST